MSTCKARKSEGKQGFLFERTENCEKSGNPFLMTKFKPLDRFQF